MRLLLLKEDYGINILVITDCDKKELKAILEKSIQNDENGIGQSFEEICNNLFPNRLLKEITSSDEINELKEINCEYFVSEKYLGFCNLGIDI